MCFELSCLGALCKCYCEGASLGFRKAFLSKAERGGLEERVGTGLELAASSLLTAKLNMPKPAIC